MKIYILWDLRALMSSPELDNLAQPKTVYQDVCRMFKNVVLQINKKKGKGIYWGQESDPTFADINVPNAINRVDLYRVATEQNNLSNVNDNMPYTCGMLREVVNEWQWSIV